MLYVASKENNRTCINDVEFWGHRPHKRHEWKFQIDANCMTVVDL